MTLIKNMQTNKLTIAALALTLSNAVQVKSQSEAEFFDAIGDWFANDFVDFWVEDVGGVLNEIGEWFAGDFVDFWTEDFVDFWTDDFVDFFGDVGEWFATDFADWWTEDFVDFWTEDFVDFWVDDIPSLVSFPTRAEREEYERKKAEHEAAVAAAQERKEKWEAQLKEIAAMCAKRHPINTPCPLGNGRMSRYTTTDDFNYKYGRNRDALQQLYDLFGKDGQVVDPDSCLEVDCLHPCYGEH